MSVDPGDEVEYGLSVEAADGIWVKASIKTRVRDGESMAECWQRVTVAVDKLLQHHAKELGKS